MFQSVLQPVSNGLCTGSVFVSNHIALVPDEYVRHVSGKNARDSPHVDLTIFLMYSCDEGHGRSMTMWPIITTGGGRNIVWGMSVTSSHLTSSASLLELVTDLQHAAVTCAIIMSKMWVVQIHNADGITLTPIATEVDVMQSFPEINDIYTQMDDNFVESCHKKILEAGRDSIARCVPADFRWDKQPTSKLSLAFSGSICHVVDDTRAPFGHSVLCGSEGELRIIYCGAVCEAAYDDFVCERSGLDQDTIFVAPNRHAPYNPAFDAADPPVAVTATWLYNEDSQDLVAHVYIEGGAPIEHVAFVSPLIMQEIDAARKQDPDEGCTDSLQRRMEKMFGFPLNVVQRWGEAHLAFGPHCSKNGYRDAQQWRDAREIIGRVVRRNLHLIKARLWAPGSPLCQRFMDNERAGMDAV